MRRSERRFREDRGLSGIPNPGALRGAPFLVLAREMGFDRAGFVQPVLLAPWADRWRRAAPGCEASRPWEEEWILSPGHWSRTSSIIVCCLSCYRREPDDLSTPGDPHGLIAPFARANYYRAAAEMLRGFAARCERDAGIPRRSIRIFTNSRIPEKPLLAAAGLGAMGKNGLCIVPGLGSLFVIAGAILPVPSGSIFAEVGLVEHAPAADPCGECDRCLRACPVGALAAPHVLDPRLCLQAIATSRQPFDERTMEAWGARLYGCQDCQAFCPHNRLHGGCTDARARPAKGELGPSIPLRPLLEMEEGARKRFFHGTALGMSWIPASSLLRGALVAAGSRGDPAAKAAVALHAGAEDPAVRGAARWALERLSRAPTCGSA